MDKWIELVKAKMSELKITQKTRRARRHVPGRHRPLAEQTSRAGCREMNRVLKALGMDFLEVALVIREPRTRRMTKSP
jgi:hypothetical protein